MIRGRSMTNRTVFGVPLIAAGPALLVSLILWYLPNSEPQSRCNIDDYGAKDMERLDLRNCELTALPRSIRDFSAVTHLDLGGNHLTTLPPLPPSIEVLFLLGNEFRDIPDSVLGLPRLRMLSFKQCKLTRLGAAPLPTSLRWLILSNNQLTSLPDWIGNLKHVRKLMLSNNRLTSIPTTMTNLRVLELVRLANNNLSTLPTFLLDLPVLSWMALAGNPGISPPSPRTSLESVTLRDIELFEKLGEGTSALVQKGVWHGTPVAVKLYKTELSSDGRNIDDVRATAAVDHPNILRTLGFFSEPKLGAVLQWAPGLVSLGKPPSLETITRDTYPAETAWTPSFVVRVACGVAEAAAHCHSRGITHGDLYAHNILVDPETGEPKLSDFGASFHYGSSSADAAKFERLEVRAYGVLLHELLHRCSGNTPQTKRLQATATACTAAPHERPLFAEILRSFEGPGGDMCASA